MTHSLIAAWWQSQVVLVFNAERHAWELPGGLIDDGETPSQAAIRELEEESGQRASSVSLVGVAEFELTLDSWKEFGALYTADLEELLPFRVNDEATGFVLWDGLADVGNIDALDAALVRLARSRA